MILTLVGAVLILVACLLLYPGSEAPRWERVLWVLVHGILACALLAMVYL